MVTKIIRVPEKKYIQTLIAGRFNSGMVIDELANHRITVPVNDMKAIYEEMVQTNIKFFQDQSVKATDEWISQLDLFPMYYYRFKKVYNAPVLGCEGAFKMLEDPKMVKYVNALALSGVPKSDIELILNARYNISYETPDFDVFIKFFANYDGWSYQDKELFIASLQDVDLRRIYKSALTSERTQLIWELGLGTDPTASFDSMMRDMFTDSYFYFKKNLKFAPDEAHKFAQLSVKLADRMDQIQDKEEKERDIFSELKFKLEVEDTKSKKKSKIMDLTDTDLEIPKSTRTEIADLDSLMNNEGTNGTQ